MARRRFQHFEHSHSSAGLIHETPFSTSPHSQRITRHSFFKHQAYLAMTVPQVFLIIASLVFLVSAFPLYTLSHPRFPHIVEILPPRSKPFHPLHVRQHPQYPLSRQHSHSPSSSSAARRTGICASMMKRRGFASSVLGVLRVAGRGGGDGMMG